MCVDLGLVLYDGATQAASLRHMLIMRRVLAWKLGLGGIGLLGVSQGAFFGGSAFIPTGALIESPLTKAPTILGEIGARRGVISMTNRHGYGALLHQSFGLLRAAAQKAWFRDGPHKWRPTLSPPAMHPVLAVGQHAVLRPIDAHPMHGRALRMWASECSQMAIAKALGINAPPPSGPR